MAPEVFRGKPHRHSDQYSFARTLFQLLTGKIPDGDWLTQMDNLGARSVLAVAGSEKPGERFSNCTEFVQRLKGALLDDTTIEERKITNLNLGDSPIPGYTLVRRLGEGAFGIVWEAERQDGEAVR